MIYKKLKTNNFYCNVLDIGYKQLVDKKIQMRLEDNIQSIYQAVEYQKPITVDFSFFSFVKKKGCLGNYKEEFVWGKMEYSYKIIGSTIPNPKFNRIFQIYYY